jgi:hypothetical protein
MIYPLNKYVSSDHCDSSKTGHLNNLIHTASKKIEAALFARSAAMAAAQCILDDDDGDWDEYNDDWDEVKTH